MNKIYLFLIVSLFSNTLFAQMGFYKVYSLHDNTRPIGLCQTLDGKFMMTGTRQTFTANNDGMLFFKLDQNGNYLFHKSYDSSGNIDYGKNVIACADSGFLFVGTSRSFYPSNNYDIWVVKTDKTGAMEWSKTIDGGLQTPDVGENAIQAPNGSYIVTGIIDYNTGALSGDAYVVNLNATGGIVWKKKLTYSNNQEANLLAKGNTGFYMSGFNGVYATTAVKATVTRMDYNGTLLWQKNYDIPNYATVKGIDVTTDQGCIVTTTNSIFKVDTNGVVAWSYAYNSNTNYSLSKVRELYNGSFIAIGSYEPGGAVSAVLYKFDNMFNIEWIKSYGPQFISNGNVEILSNGEGYAFAGIGTPVVAGLSPTCALIKTDTNGVSPCYSTMVMPQNMTITTQAATITNNTITPATVGYIFAQYWLTEPTSVLNSASRCLATGVENGIAESALMVYPNPSQGLFTVELNTESTLTIADISGRIVYSTKCQSGINHIDVQQLTSGVYFLTAQQSNGTIATQKIVIE